ncbi:MAG: hypothetical protein M3020_08560 [Myxococcota bacterium]|jgi:hypothetical protein|nr:hypothetical protein [Myxococcota bacterium]
MKRISSWMTAMTLVGLSSVAHAQPGAEPHVEGSGASYSVQFLDDPLNALGQDGVIPTIRVRPTPLRTTLIRPRTSFVTELLKSEAAF